MAVPYRKPRSKKVDQKTTVIVNDLKITSADRGRKDIASFHMALVGAEMVQNPNRTRLYDLYDRVTLDGHLSGIIQKRIDQVTNKKLQFLDKQGKEVEGMYDLLESEKFRDVMRQILDSKFYGISGLEFIPGPLLEFEEIPRKHIKTKTKTISIHQSSSDGISYDGLSNVWVVGKPQDLGLLLKCSPYAIYKAGAIADYSQYIELFGQPVRVVKYDAYDEKTQLALRKTLDESGSSLALMIPKQADFEMLDGKGSNANGDLQDKFRKACNEEMSVVILGNTETTSSSKSSGYAQSKEHGEQQDEIIFNDMKFLQSHLNSEHFLNILRSYGYPVEGGRFDWEDDIDLNTLKLRLEIDKEVCLKVPFGDDYWYDMYKIPKPDNYAELKKQIETQEEVDIEEDDEEPTPQKTVNKKPSTVNKKPKEDLSAQLSTWQNLMAKLADFFDHARS